MNALIRTHQNKPVTTSRLVAEKFGKRHDNLLQSIKRLECGPEFNLLNFKEVDYTDETGRTYKEFLITRDGFTLLVMGFTGKEAMRFKIEYINAFNEYERVVAEVQNENALVIAHIEKLTEAISNLAIGYNARMNGFEERLNRLEARPTVPLLTEQSFNQAEEKWYTISDYAKKIGVFAEIDGEQAEIGRIAYNWGLKKKIKPIRHEIDGLDHHINKWPEERMLKPLFQQYLYGSGKRKDLFNQR